MQNLPGYLTLLFIASVIFTAFCLLQSASFNRIMFTVIVLWLTLQGILSAAGFYTHTNGVPPRFALSLFPPTITIIFMFFSKNGRHFIDGLNRRTLTLLHLVRLPVEIVLLILFVHKVVPRVMTLEGRNFDVLSGLTAPLVFYFGYIVKKWSPRLLLVWNLICLALLANIVIIAIISAPFQFQQMAFEQPNIAVLHFPYIWLPSFIVPAVLLAHLVNIRFLWRELRRSSNQAKKLAASIFI